MILKERDIPLRILQNDVLLRRLPANHSKRPDIEEDQAKRLAGLRGEKNLAYHLQFIPPNKYDIIHDLRLINAQNFAFQMDTLVLTTSFLLILETKNIQGSLFFDTHSKQLLRTVNEKEEGFSNPITQVERHAAQLKEWLRNHHLPELPIEYNVVISFPSSIIKSNHNGTFQKVFHAEHLSTKIKAYEKIHRNQMDRKDYRKLTRTLLKKHTPLKLDILKVYDIKPEEVRTGVQCENCAYLPLDYHYGKWICPKCKMTFKHAHMKAMEDYFYVINPQINNRQCREFLHLTSRYVTHELLEKMNLKRTGNTKGSWYHW